MGITPAEAVGTPLLYDDHGVRFEYPPGMTIAANGGWGGAASPSMTDGFLTFFSDHGDPLSIGVNWSPAPDWSYRGTDGLIELLRADLLDYIGAVFSGTPISPVEWVALPELAGNPAVALLLDLSTDECLSRYLVSVSSNEEFVYRFGSIRLAPVDTRVLVDDIRALGESFVHETP